MAFVVVLVIVVILLEISHTSPEKRHFVAETVLEVVD
jgi:hypothetical protein